jgi:23S rRNA-/tRNA-specific pseudouridylate synthase
MRVAHSSHAAAAAPLPDALCATFPGAFATMTAARKACRRRRVLVDGATSGCGAQVCVGQLLQVLEPVEQPGSFSTDPQQRGQRRPRATPPPPGIHIPILFDDDYITAVVKPWGIKCHGYGSHHLAAYVRALVPPSNQGACARR